MNHKPVILNIFKPAGITSYDVIRKFKPRLKKLGKVGHFGTLDPFASGVLMLGVAGAQKLNEFIHECLPKTYLAVGVLGVETPTGDMTVEASQLDNSAYLNETIAHFDKMFIQDQIQKKFLGEYFQAPHKYSAAKYEGKALHQWAREGIEIKKEQKRREIYKIEVVEYNFPILKIRCTVSSGTYVRTLFSDCAQHLGTIGTLKELIREEVGGCNLSNTLALEKHELEELPFLDIDSVLDFDSIIYDDKESRLFTNGVRLQKGREIDFLEGSLKSKYFWVKNKGLKIIGLAMYNDENLVKSLINYN